MRSETTKGSRGASSRSIYSTHSIETFKNIPGMLRICLCLAVFVMAMADETDMQAKAKQLEEDFKSNMSPEQKKAKFNEFLTSLGGDYKVKNLGNRLLSQFEAGAFFSGMENAKAMITKEVADAQLTDADKAEMKSMKEEFGQKFHNMFKGVLPKGGHATPAPPA
ncbi:hypothetical protein OSTOST_03278 [Ostertagia ostertagi]